MPLPTGTLPPLRQRRARNLPPVSAPLSAVPPLAEGIRACDGANRVGSDGRHISGRSAATAVPADEPPPLRPPPSSRDLRSRRDRAGNCGGSRKEGESSSSTFDNMPRIADRVSLYMSDDSVRADEKLERLGVDDRKTKGTACSQKVENKDIDREDCILDLAPFVELARSSCSDQDSGNGKDAPGADADRVDCILDLSPFIELACNSSSEEDRGTDQDAPGAGSDTMDEGDHDTFHHNYRHSCRHSYHSSDERISQHSAAATAAAMATPVVAPQPGSRSSSRSPCEDSDGRPFPPEPPMHAAPHHRHLHPILVGIAAPAKKV